MARPTTHRGFTLVELILVMTIMTLIGLFAAMAIHNVHDHAKIAETKATIQLIEVALEEYKADFGGYPTGDAASTIAALTTPSSTGWRRAGMEWFPDRAEVKDAWGMDFYYCPNRKISTDPNGKEYDESGRGVERDPGKKNFYNMQTFQLYSTGPNMKTWLPDQGKAESRLCGTEEDDIRNWKHERFLTKELYDALP